MQCAIALNQVVLGNFKSSGVTWPQVEVETFRGRGNLRGRYGTTEFLVYPPISYMLRCGFLDTLKRRKCCYF